MGDISTYLEMKFHIHNPTISAITIIKWSIVGILMDILKLKNVQFINDIIARFKLTTDCQLHSFKAMTIENINPISLKSFKGLKSLARDKLKEKYQRVETRADDYVFGV